MLDAALAYSKRKLPIIPLHGIVGGLCTCGKKECHSPGKHPRISDWVAKGTTDPEQIKAWWGNHPSANIGLLTGEKSGVVVVDVDPRNGGDDSLTELEAEIGALPPTKEVVTGGDGRHIYFKYPETKLKNRASFRPGLDFKTDGGFVVAPPSLHISGKKYEWEVSSFDDGVEFADMPAGLIKALTSPKNVIQTEEGAKISKGQRNETLTSFAGSMRHRGMHESSILAALIEENKTQCAPPLNDTEVARISNSISKYKPGKGVSNEPSSWPAPMNRDAFHGLVGEMTECILPHTESDEAALLIQFHVMFGNLVGRSPNFVVEADRHGANQFCVIVGETSRGRKGTSLGHIKKMMRGADEQWFCDGIRSGLSSGEGLINLVRDPVSKEVLKDGSSTEYITEVVDEGVEDKRKLIIQSEFSSVLKMSRRNGNILSDVLRDAWDHGDLSSIIVGSDRRATGGHISLIGHITLEELRFLLPTVEAFNGFSNRFLWICARRSKALPFGGDVSEKKFNSLVAGIKKAAEFSKKVGQLRFDNPARTLWATRYHEFNDGVPGILGAVTSRAEPQVLRLALIYALLDRAEYISDSHLRAALAVWDYSEASCRHIFGDRSGNPIVDKILSELKGAPKGLSKTEISGAFSRNLAAEEINCALTHLESTGKAIRSDSPTEGRSESRWVAA